jgi:hypothetical protein
MTKIEYREYINTRYRFVVSYYYVKGFDLITKTKTLYFNLPRQAAYVEGFRFEDYDKHDTHSIHAIGNSIKDGINKDSYTFEGIRVFIDKEYKKGNMSSAFICHILKGGSLRSYSTGMYDIQ